jgi:hypothetical protein
MSHVLIRSVVGGDRYDPCTSNPKRLGGCNIIHTMINFGGLLANVKFEAISVAKS